MNFVALFRPYRVIPNTLNPSFDGLDWGAMRTMFEGCVSPLPTAEQRSQFSCVIAPLRSLVSHPIAASLSHPAIFSATSGWEHLIADLVHGNDEIDVSIQNLIGPSSAAEKWADMGGKRTKIEVLRAWLGRGQNKGIIQRLQEVEQESDEEEMGRSAAHALARPSRVAGLFAPIRPNDPPRSTATVRRHAVDSDDSSDEGGSDDHARTAWKLFGSGIPEGVPRHWLSPQRDSQSQIGVVEGGGTLPTPVSSPVARPIAAAEKGSPLCPSPFATLDNIEFATSISPDMRLDSTTQHSETGERLFTCIDNLVGAPPSADINIRSSGVQPQGTRSEEQSLIPHSHQRKRSVEEFSMESENSGLSIVPAKRPKIDQVRSTAKTEADRSNKMDQPSDRLPAIRSTPAHSPSSSISPRKLTKVATVPEIIVQAPPPTRSLQENQTPGSTSSSVARSARPTLPFLVTKSWNKDGPPAPTKSSSEVIRRSPSHLSKDSPIYAPLHRVASSHSVTEVAIITTSSESHGVPSVSDHPVSPHTAERRARRAEQKILTEKLRLACPQRARANKRARRESGGTGPLASQGTSVALPSNSSQPPSAMDCLREGSSTAVHARVNWEKSLRLAEEVREAVKNGRRVSDVLPRLRCLR